MRLLIISLKVYKFESHRTLGTSTPASNPLEYFSADPDGIPKHVATESDNIKHSRTAENQL